MHRRPDTVCGPGDEEAEPSKTSALAKATAQSWSSLHKCSTALG